ncbi:hypothetical protein ASD50_20975 [Mesorhizobium sp. Root552]|uniref:hypothetical protein n=1 Tax=Mesorhizobium sp. Root552 TaxID=1736555 RepID=UPI0006F604FC|nr:hypothetical protein [Mesorhizobium sp. Root552]KQZ22926.1 hypothetical protein ASD50_20975 [Mesorhizobium sp. Root552]
MASKIETIICGFIGDFKVGDNLVRNADALCRLSEANVKGLLNKLIVIQAGSITEAALDQIIYRAQNFNREGVPNISEADRKAIEATTVERFNNILQTMQKYKILDGLGGGVYDELHKLRRYRNRVHIQIDTDPKDAPRDEDGAFSTKVVKWSLDLCITVLKYLAATYPRPKGMERYAHALSIPVD